VRLVAVLAEALAVVARRDDQQPGISVALAQCLKQPSELRVHEGNLARIRLGREGAREARGRVVGQMRVVEVHPEKKARPERPRRERGVDHLGRRRASRSRRRRSFWWSS
jgi:hypothetical protein